MISCGLQTKNRLRNTFSQVLIVNYDSFQKKNKVRNINFLELDIISPFWFSALRFQKDPKPSNSSRIIYAKPKQSYLYLYEVCTNRLTLTYLSMINIFVI